MRNYIHILTVLISAVVFTSCGEYQRILKSNDPDERLEYAKRAFEQKKYTQAATVLTDIVTMFKGTQKAEDSLYLLALSHYENKDYENAGAYFQTYYNRYPKGKYAEMARFYCGYGYFLDSPEPQLDQSGTIKAIEELQAFLDSFPRATKCLWPRTPSSSCKTNSRSKNCRTHSSITTWATIWATTTNRRG